MAKKLNYADLYTLRSDGRYMGYYRDEEGKRHSVYDKDPEKLHMKIQAKLDALAAPRAVTFKDIAEAWHDEVWENFEDGTVSAYKAPYDRAVNRFGDWLVEEITPRDILAHLTDLRNQKYSKRTVKAQKTIYNQIFQAAIISKEFEKYVTTNPAAVTPMPKGLPPAKKREAPEDDMIQTIQDHAETAYFGLFPMFLICTGFRRREALAIKWGDVDFKNKTISCSKQISTRGATAKEKQPKTAAGTRVVPLLPPLEAVLHKPANAAPEDYLFYGSDPKKPMSNSTYKKRWMHYCKDMGFVRVSFEEERVSKQNHKYTYTEYEPTITAHNLRHGYVTILFEAGVDEYTTMRLAGHSDISVTRAIYTHLRNRKQQQSTELLMNYTKNGLVVVNPVVKEPEAVGTSQETNSF